MIGSLRVRTLRDAVLLRDRAVFEATQSFPREEQYGLTSQLRRATVSVPGNIAEGCGRNSDVELARFLEIAYGSASESDYQLLLAKGLGYLDEESFVWGNRYA